jgi:hypothetical protein
MRNAAQVPDAIAGQSVLAAAGLAAQAHRNVMLPYGQTRPLSLFMVAIAASGDRKTTADVEALSPIRQHEKNLREQYKVDAERYRIASTAWEGSVKKIKNSARSTNEAREKALRELGPGWAGPTALPNPDGAGPDDRGIGKSVGRRSGIPRPVLSRGRSIRRRLRDESGSQDKNCSGVVRTLGRQGHKAIAGR